MKEGKGKYLPWIALVVILLLVNLPESASRRLKARSREIIAPFQDVVFGLFLRVSESLSVLISPGERNAMQEKLLEKLIVLHERVRQLQSLEQENAILREKLGFLKEAERELVLCEVITRGDTSGWWETIRLNKGKADGISADFAVITTNGLVGKTISASWHTCDVLLVTDPNCRVSALFPRTGAFGIAEGRGASITGNPAVDMRCPLNPGRVDYVMRNVNILKGDEVVTSGLGGTYPAGLLVGRVESTEVHKSGLYQSAYVMPAADLQNLRYVFVVKKEKQP